MRTRRYEPLIVLQNRPYSRAVRYIADGDRDAATHHLKKLGPLPAESIRRLDTLAGSALAVEIMAHHFRRAIGPQPLTSTNYLTHIDEIAITQAIFGFLKAGRQIVQFDDALTSEFRLTDLDGMMIEDINLPWDAFYLSFSGPDSPHSVDFPIDGCMVRDDADSDSIILTPYFENDADWALPRMHQSLVLALPKSSGSDLPTTLINSARAFDKAVAGLSARHIPSHLLHVANDIVDNCQSREPLVGRLLNLVGNALLYLTARPSDGVTGWQQGAPHDLATRAAAGGVGADKAAQALVRDGYAKVRFVSLPAGQQDSTGSGSVRAHWRRGHWKRQPYGPRASLRKVIRVRPMLVAGGIEQANEHGRVHLARAGDRRRTPIEQVQTMIA